jgi:diaminopimelate epimerase
MERSVAFYKISAAGNDFILIDNRRRLLPRSPVKLVSRWFHRKFGIGADGVILLEESSKADFRMRYFNADGSAAAMCGNGGRSIARFAHLLGIAGTEMTFETDAGLIQARILGKTVRLRLSEPRGARLDFPLKVDRREFSASFINTGVPHTVIFVNDIDRKSVV